MPATAPAAADVPQVPVDGTRAGDGVLTIGTILPQTGSLAFLGPPEFAGFDLAIKDINDAGGVLGKPVEGIKGDSGDTTTDTANQTVDRLLSQNVDAIIGAASSGVSLTVIDKITGAGVVQFSPANTSKKLSTYADKGLYFRTAPSDILQGAVLGEVIADDGNANVAIIARNDAYGTGLAEDTTKALADAGVKVVAEKIYDQKAPDLRRRGRRDRRGQPGRHPADRLRRGSRILTTMVEKGIGPARRPSTAPTATSATRSARTSTPASDAGSDELKRDGAPAIWPGPLRVRATPIRHGCPRRRLRRSTPPTARRTADVASGYVPTTSGTARARLAHCRRSGRPPRSACGDGPHGAIRAQPAHRSATRRIAERSE